MTRSGRERRSEIDRRPDAQHERVLVCRGGVAARKDHVLRVELEIHPARRLPAVPGFHHIFVVLHIAGADTKGVRLGLSVRHARIDMRRADGEAPPVLGAGADPLLEDPEGELSVRRGRPLVRDCSVEEGVGLLKLADLYA